MSWATVTKKTEPPPQNILNIIKPVKEELIYDDFSENIDIGTITKEENLFSDLLPIKENSATYSPWLLSKATTYDILEFISNYIDLNNSIKVIDYESDNSEFMDMNL
uniref:Uncharacterized protein n=1 Tax=viral metagenome TaxID=1070528 RepID=A0A6C0EP65_9ZZZZ